MCFVWWVAASEVFSTERLDFAFWELMEGQTVSVWLEIWRGAFWRYFETIHRLWSKIWYLRHCRRRELLLSRWRIEVRPNGVEMAQNFMCSSFLAILKDLAVFVWFWQDLKPEAALPVCSRMRLHIAFYVDEAKWHFWCRQPFGGILRPSIGSYWRFDVFDTVAAGSSCSAIGRLKLGQTMLKWPETSCVPLFWLFWEILQFLFDYDKIWCLKRLCLFVIGCGSI